MAIIHKSLNTIWRGASKIFIAFPTNWRRKIPNEPGEEQRPKK